MTAADARPTITVRPALVAVTDEALVALDSSAHGIFLRGRLLVQVARVASDLRWLTRPRGAPDIVPLSDAAITVLLPKAEFSALRDQRFRSAGWGVSSTDLLLEERQRR